MTLAVFPTFPGLGFDNTRTALWSTKIQTSDSGDECRRGRYSYPKYEFGLAYEVLEENQDLVSGAYETLIGFFNAHHGAELEFLFEDAPRSGTPRNQVTGQVLGVGDGATTRFQLVHNLGGFIEPIRDLKGSAVVRVGGIATTSFSVDATGGIVLAAPPAAGSSVAADFAFYYRCRFKDDQLSATEFADALWQTDTLTLRSLKVPQRSSP
ncbi:MAG: DUF2460 domain-containing protein [Magnetospirillum sp.]|nr:DUF2460 domain-containing protein [Magnetospirillum sp.]